MKSSFVYQRCRTSESGSATFVFIALLAIMLILVTANSRALFQLHRQTVLLEQKQNKKWAAPATMSTNTATPPVPESK